MSDDELTPEQRFAMEAESVTVPRALRAGQSKESIIADLVRRDWDPAEAKNYVEQFDHEPKLIEEDPEARLALARHYGRLSLFGLFLCALGLLLPLLSLLAALSAVRGGTTLIF